MATKYTALYKENELQETISITPSSNSQSIKLDDGKIAVKNVEIAAAPTEVKTITENGTYSPSSDKIGFSQIIVSVSAQEVEIYSGDVSITTS